MNKKLTFTGGEPDITIDNLQYDPIANRAALFGFTKAFAGDDSVIVSGAVVTVIAGVSASVTAGYVFLNGEILQVDAATVSETLGSDLWEFQKVVTYDAAGDKTFNDAIPRQTYQKNRAVLVNVSAITGMDAQEAREAAGISWMQLTSDEANYTLDMSNAYIGISPNKIVHMKGWVGISGSSVSPFFELFKTPTSLTPSVNRGVTAVDNNDDITLLRRSAVISSSTEKALFANVIGGDKFYLDGITYAL